MSDKDAICDCPACNIKRGAWVCGAAAAHERMTPRCKYCLAGNPVGKDGWHTTEYQGGYPFSSVFCAEALAMASDNMAKQPECQK